MLSKPRLCLELILANERLFQGYVWLLRTREYLLKFKETIPNFCIYCYDNKQEPTNGHYPESVCFWKTRYFLWSTKCCLALFRVKSIQGLKLLILDNDRQVGIKTSNVVYKEVFTNLRFVTAHLLFFWFYSRLMIWYLIMVIYSYLKQPGYYTGI